MDGKNWKCNGEIIYVTDKLVFSYFIDKLVNF